MSGIVLAVSTFRESDRAVECAIEKASGQGELYCIYIIDVRLSEYCFAESGGSCYPKWKKRYIKEVLASYRHKAERTIQAIKEQADQCGLEVKAEVQYGGFAKKCVTFIQNIDPDAVVTTRAQRPGILRKIFGSHVDYIIEHVDCPVIEI